MKDTKDTEEPKFKVGDKVATTSDVTNFGHTLTNGTVVEVRELAVNGTITDIRKITVDKPHEHKSYYAVTFQDNLGVEFCMDEEFLKLQKQLVQKLKLKDQLQSTKFAVFDRVQILVGINKDEIGTIATIEPNPEDTADDPKIWVNLDKYRQSLKSPFAVLEFWPDELKLIGQEEHTPISSQPPNPTTTAIKPDYYQITINGQQIECLDVIDALGLNFNIGNALKYIWRAKSKNGGKEEMQAYQKAITYLQKQIDKLSKR